MDWVILFFVLVVLGMQIYTQRQLDDVRRRQRQTLNALDQFRTRQGSIAQGRRTSAVPSVDTRVVTTHRDSDDLPVTGRMSMAVHRDKRDYDRADTDD